MDSSKNTIMEIAVKLFSQKGYQAVGVQEICDNAKITKPTLYYYFKSKQGLLEYIVSEKGGELYSRIQQALEYKHDFILSLTNLLKAEIQFAEENPDYFLMHSILVNSPEGSEERIVYLSLIDRIEAKFLEFFQLSSNEFGNMRGKEMLYSINFHNTVISTALLINRKKLKYSEQLVYQIVHSVVYGLAN